MARLSSPSRSRCRASSTRDVRVDHVHRGAPPTSRLALVVGIVLGTRRMINNVRWSIEERPPTRDDQRNTFLAPWRLARVLLALWGVGTVAAHHALRTAGHRLHPEVAVRRQLPRHRRRRQLLSVHRVRAAAGGRAGAGGRPAAAPVRRRASWAAPCWCGLLGSGVPVLGICLAGADHAARCRT